MKIIWTHMTLRICFGRFREYINEERGSHMTAESLIRELPKGLVKWQNFKKGGQGLYITADTALDRGLAEALAESGMEVEIRRWEQAVEEEASGVRERLYDCIVMGSALEYAKTAGGEKLLAMAHETLKADGRLWVCADNRLAIRYFCGDRDPFTGRNFDGIENYRRISDRDQGEQRGRLYAKADLARMLRQAGFDHHRFYSVFPEITCPQILIAEDYTPKEELKIRIFPQYGSPDTVFLEEENLYTALMENQMLHAMANGFLIECSLDGSLSDACQITVSMCRGREHALYTIIRRSGNVEKTPVYKEGRKKARMLMDNNRYLERHGVKMIEARILGRSFVMPCVQGMPLATYFRRLADRDEKAFFRQFDRLWELILSSSEHVPYEEVEWERFNPWWDEEEDEKARSRTDRSRWKKAAFEHVHEKWGIGPILRRGYLDLVLINGFALGDEFVFYDQELYASQVPAKAVMLRNIDFLYHGDMQMQKLLPRKELMSRYGIEEYQEIYYSHIGHFLTKLRNDRTLREFYESRRRNDETVHSNRQRMNYSAAEYQRLFVDIFKNMERKRVYLFGSGKFGERFLALYKDNWDIAGILDNDERKWGDTVNGVKVMPPSVLEGMDASVYKVILCIKNYTGVLKQVKKLGATNIGIYDTNMEYDIKPGKAAEPAVEEKRKKKYHVGYVAGVFDLFHVGHLNLLRRAKEQCDYLIAGVVTDEGVREFKNIESFVPFEERLEVVRACRYVDEAVEIPLEFYDTRDAYFRFRFDVQFSGSDYSDDPAWLKKRDFLRSRGGELVFFPYTESTSSTKLKEAIERRLL